MAKVRQRTGAALAKALGDPGSDDDPAMIWREDFGVSKKCDLHPKTPERLLKGGKGLPQYTMAEVAKHSTKDDCWIILDDRVYDITRFIDKHPGGVGPVVNMAGKDATDVFANYHAARVYKTMLPTYLIGECSDVVVYPHVADFRKARQQMLEQGLFQTDYTYYGKLSMWLATLFLSSVGISLGWVGGGSSGMRMFGAAIMGIFWQQLAGLGHDLGHSGVTHNFHKDHFIGSLLSAFMGLSVGWWKSDHNTHHVVCNAVEHDPNIQHMPLLAITDKIYEKPFWDTYHKKTVAMDSIARFMVSYQHIIFYPFMMIARWNLYVQGIIFLVTEADLTHYKYTELTGLAVYFTWMFKLAFSMPTGWDTFNWIMVSHAVAGILHVQIVLSHWSMETYKGSPYTTKNTEWYLMQLRTTMNVDTYEWADFMHIGLQFQIEHHLYPRLPRHNLRKARKLVLAIAKKHDIPYHEPGFFEGNVEMWHALKDAAMGARKTTKGDGGFYQSMLWEGMNAKG
jgi:delta8-fatty-acid desaturase